MSAVAPFCNIIYFFYSTKYSRNVFESSYIDINSIDIIRRDLLDRLGAHTLVRRVLRGLPLNPQAGAINKFTRGI